MNNKEVIQNEKKQNKVLFDLKECDELFQKDKSLKQAKDIVNIQNQIKQMKDNELNFYKNLRLDNKSKEKIFGIKPDSLNSKINQNVEDEQSNIPNNGNNSRTDVNGKVIVQDPLQGNLIMTIQEYNNIYLKDPMNF
ncbi:hypothetical protein TTHERM_00424730 (macronuclear) [Tetrahymena thermophila SB210]|uniref:Uncharacterized protein n=1 Tax=Tetrahymena thermophila (strain SB210) TaxID=312017 RepID=Q23AI7_TETTS|nr:hypothetical protein TTHERM_00424730 [Tetrahymena thermophila SB210]EAR93505.1 hypothetical protein TTHERM_00424730 [Tetrahymena thermophila SB210]|eukprot:XP_001013750.1 hypothetical protein TTHERM_00424730 [Tetrahymena thermophila SB210]